MSEVESVVQQSVNELGPLNTMFVYSIHHSNPNSQNKSPNPQKKTD
jgi:hypothetical protein